MRANIKIQPFGADVIFVFDEEFSKASKALEKLGGEGSDLEGAYTGVTVRLEQLKWFVYIPSTKIGDIVYLVQTIVHESIHVVNQLMVECQIDCEETVAYTMDNLVGQMISKVLKTKEN